MKASVNFAARLETAIDASHISTDAAVCSEYIVDEVVPAVVATPVSAEEVAEIVRFTALEKLALIPCGNRTKIGIGMPPARYDLALDMTGLNRIAHYDPGDLTLSVDAGTSFNEFAVPLYNQKQFLPLAVPYYFESTIGGIVASGVDSSLRHSYGTVRDFLIGAEFVDGTGRLCKSGGRVVKNVTGYDLHKLLIGSLGTLAVITRLNLRTFPSAPASRGFVASLPTPQGALSFGKLIEDSPLRPATIELVSPSLMRFLLEAEGAAIEPPAMPLQGMFPDNFWHLCVSVEGSSEVCGRATREFAHLAASYKDENLNLQLATLGETQGADLWHYIGQAVPFLLESSPSAAIFKITLLPARMGNLLLQLHSLADESSLPHATLARACGVIYFALLPSPPGPPPLQLLAEAASKIFALCQKEGASATLPWCPTALKRQVNIWGTPRADLALQRRLKSAFDPQNLFAPSRVFS